jgi:hypothetical protein
LDVESGLALYDVSLVVGASELDRLCAAAVSIIAEGGKVLGPLLDTLSVLEPDRIVAMWLALPEERRHVVLRNYVWARYVREADEQEIAEAAADIDDLNRMPITPLARSLARAHAAGDESELGEALSRLRAEETHFALAHGIEGSTNGWQ